MIIFTHIDPKTGKNLNFNVTGIMGALCALPRAELQALGVYFALDHNMAAHYRRVRGIEARRYNRLNADCFHYPLLVADLGEAEPDGRHIIIDGNHRYVWLSDHGFVEAKAYIIPEPIWRPYILDWLPDTDTDSLLSQDSGIR